MAEQTVTITIDGTETQVAGGEALIKAAEERGTYIPRFCWHPRMRAVGMCRMCLVEVETPRGRLLTTSCTTPVSEGMIVHTKSAVVEKAQEGVLEFLLLNHPLDCPVCDKGGECPLQDQTMAYGPGDGRYVEAKRHFEKPVAISELVLMDRERCILCDRCTRFSAEVSGDPLIAFMSRGNTTEVITFPDEPFASYFSGNTVQLCPVGALTAKPFRFKARPWDLEAVESVSLVDTVHSRISLQSSQNRLTRVYGVDNGRTNQGWLSDKDRFIYEHVHSPDRVTTPLLRDGDEFRPASWAEAIAVTANRLGSVLGTEVGAIGGARSLNEDAFAFSKFMRTAVVSPHIDAQVGDGLSAEFAAAVTPRATIDDLDRAGAILLWGPDLKESLPVLYLRVRRAAKELGVPLVVVHPRRTGLDDVATGTLRYRPGTGPDLLRRLSSGDGDVADVATVLAAGPVVALVGRTGLAEDPRLAEAVAAWVRDMPGGRIMPLLRRGNVFGALDMGLAPGLLPGRASANNAASRMALEEHWGVLPSGVARDATGILEGLRDGDLKALVLFGADPMRDHPNPVLAEEALGAADFVVAFEMFMSESAASADVIFPVAGMGETEGTATNIEGRVQKVNRLVPPAGMARPAWSILDDLANRMGAELGASSGEALAAEIAEVAPAYGGITWEALEWGEGRQGIVVPSDDGSQPLEHIPVATTIPVVADRMGLHLGTVLYDDGVLVTNAEALSALRTEPHAHLHPRDASALAVTDGDRVIVTGKAAVELPVRLDPTLAPHTVYIPFNLGVTAPLGAEPAVSVDAVRPAS